jgi:hypothetical protein
MYRGRSKVQFQAYRCAIVQNLKRPLFHFIAGWLRAGHRQQLLDRLKSKSAESSATKWLIEKLHRTFSTGAVVC